VASVTSNNEVVYPSDLSCFTAKNVDNRINRDSLLDTIELKFESHSKIVLISGDKGMGKSELLSQFLQRYKNSCIGIFIDVINKQSYCEDNIVKDLFRQVSFYLNGVDPNDFEQVGTKEFNSILYLLDSYLKKDKKKIYLIIDGLEEIPSQDHYVIKSILDVMPFSSKNIKFIFSSSNNILEDELYRQKVVTIEMVTYTEHEAIQALKPLDECIIRKLLQAYKAVPETISSIKRLIEGGMNPEDIVEKYTFGTADLLEAEWDRENKIVSSHRQFFALVAYSIYPLKIEQIKHILKIRDDVIKNIVESARILVIDNNLIKFITNGMKDFAKIQLKDLKDDAINNIISSYQKMPDDNNDINKYHELQGNYPAIVEQLSDSNISSIFYSTNSINEVVKQVKLGLKSATELKLQNDIIRYSNAYCILSSIKSSKLLKSELQCHLAEDDYKSALSLVSSSNVIEERLQLLAVIASYQKNKKDLVDEEISERIDEYFDLIDPEYLSIEQTIELASELFSVFPEKALSLINKIDSLEYGGKNKADYAFLRLSVDSFEKDNATIESLLENDESVSEIKREFLDLVGMFRQGTTADKILLKLENNYDVGDKIFILSNWIKKFPKDKGTFKLITELISLVISATDYYANATMYADILPSLQYMNEENGSTVLEKIKPEFEKLKVVGPTVDYVKCQANISAFEDKYGLESSRKVELVDYVCSEIDDVSIKLSSICMLMQLNFFDNNSKIKIKLEEEKEKSFTKLIKATGLHVTNVKDALLREVDLSVKNALSWCARLNTQPRKDYARSIVIKKICKIGSISSIESISSEIRKINNKDNMNTAIKALFDYAVSMNKPTLKEYKKLVKLRNRVKDNLLLYSLNTQLLLLLNKITADCSKQKKSAIEAIELVWNGIDGDWHKINAAYEIHNMLIESNRDLAIKYKNKAINLRLDNNADNAEVINSYVLSIDLVIRALYYLCLENIDTADDVEDIIKLIDTIPSRILRVKQLARLASVFHLTNKLAYFDELIEKYLIINIEEFGTVNSKELSVGFYWAAPILFLYQRNIFDRIFSYFLGDDQYCDTILTFTMNFIMNKSILGDPFEPVKKYKYKLDIKDLENCLYLINLYDEDSRLYSSLQKTIDIVIRGKKQNSYSETQLAQVEASVIKLIDTKFSSERYILHDGYKICCTALLFKLKQVKSENSWNNLIKDVGRIPVKSDRVYVIGEIIESMSPRMLTQKKKLLSEAVRLTHELPSYLEKISRFEYLAEIGESVDKRIVRKFLREAVLLSAREDNSEYEERRLSLINSIYAMDKKFAGGLSAAIDDDPARKKLIEENILKNKNDQKIAEEFDLSNKDLKENVLSQKYPKLIWKLLAKLNASNHVPDKKSDYDYYLNSISQYDYNAAYPMLSYYIHSIGSQCKSKAVATRKMRPIYKSFYSSAILFSRFSNLHRTKTNTPIINNKQIIFDHHEANKATDFIKEWVEEISEVDNKMHLTIIDPYFNVNDLELIGNVIDKDPNFHIRILTSFTNIKLITQDTDTSVKEALTKFWVDNVTSETMPFLDIVFCGVPSLDNTLPIHDRWWISGKTGLSLGCSMNGIGASRISAISKLNHEEVLQIEDKINAYLFIEQRMYNAERINYQTITI